MHEADDTYSIRSTWSCYWLDQFLTLALNTLIFSIFIFHWICLPSILLILVGAELPLCVVVTIPECCVMFSGVKLSMGSFVLFIIDDINYQINSSVYVANGGHYYARLIKIHIHLIAFDRIVYREIQLIALTLMTSSKARAPDLRMVTRDCY